MGFEPTTLGTTILYSNRLSYIHHMICFQIGCKYTHFFLLSKIFVKHFIQKHSIPRKTPCKDSHTAINISPRVSSQGVDQP